MTPIARPLSFFALPLFLTGMLATSGPVGASPSQEPTGQPHRPAALLSATNTIAHPDEEVIVRVKLESDDIFRRDLPEQKVSFSLGGELLGVAITGPEGIARLAVRLEEAGTHRLRAELSPDSPYRAKPTEAAVTVLPKDTSIVICLIDDTLTDQPTVLFLVTPNDEVPPREGAAKALTRIRERYLIIYATGRGDTVRRKQRDWMETHEIACGPLLEWNRPGEDLAPTDAEPGEPESPEEIGWLRSLKERWPGLTAGIGSSKSHADAFTAAGLAAVILRGPGVDPDGEEAAAPTDPAGSKALAHWNEIADHLLDGAGAEEAPPPAGPKETPGTNTPDRGSGAGD